MRVEPQSVTGLVLAGGRGSRMGGIDKGLQTLHGTPLALHALLRLQMQQGHRLAGCMINANRHLGAYEAFGVPVWPDTLEGYAGPLAGFLTGLERCETPYLLTVPCDAPRFPLDLLERLAHALEREHAEIAMAAGPEGDPGPTNPSRPQPVFCLLHVDLLESLTRFTQAGGRKIDAWTAQHRTVIVPFDQPGDDPLAFCNTNTLDELRAIESRAL
ncbi:molybdenum cofactor guanylyltransferase MobA [Tepidicella baoligensis]|uniref:molybdenum cofactor guanylyltransferase MobA n=1 Tax=Tepidicella baoligensis TaxID=2707016 RepID=UPI0015D9C281|nr:molybdenum cofactor guanylyltransferase MobA [Tepidicella baoligensis]